MTLTKPPILAVAFDVDGTLYPNWNMYLRSIPFGLTHLRLVRAYSRIRRKIRTIRPIEDFASLERRLLAEELGVGETRAEKLIEFTIHEVWESVFNHVKPFAHVRWAIEWIRDHGMRVAVSSDFPVESKLVRLGLDDLFDCTLWSASSGYLKPHPEPFADLMECVGVSAESLLYVGNSYEYDIVGARASGLRTAHLRRKPVRNTLADFTFCDYRRLPEWIDQFNAVAKGSSIQ